MTMSMGIGTIINLVHYLEFYMIFGEGWLLGRPWQGGMMSCIVHVTNSCVFAFPLC